MKLEEYAKEHEELGVALGVWSKKTDFKICFFSAQLNVKLLFGMLLW